MKIKNAFYILSVLGISAFVFCIFSYSMGYNIVATNYNLTVFVSKISPQGWGFFANSPRKDPYIHVYAIDKDGTPHDIMPVNSALVNIGGLHKRSRMVNFELNSIIRQADTAAWKPFDGTFTRDTSQYRNVSNNRLHFFKEGRYAIVTKKIRGYLLRDVPDKNNKKVLYVNCTEK